MVDCFSLMEFSDFHLRTERLSIASRGVRTSLGFVYSIVVFPSAVLPIINPLKSELNLKTQLPFLLASVTNATALFFTLRNKEQLLATDILVLVSMKNAAKCDT